MGVSLLRVQLGLQQRDPGEALGGCIYLQGLRGRMPSPECGPKFKNVLQRGRQASQHLQGSCFVHRKAESCQVESNWRPSSASCSSSSFCLEVFAYTMTHNSRYLWCLNPFHLGPFLLSISMFSLCLIWMTRPSRQEQYLP